MLSVSRISRGLQDIRGGVEEPRGSDLQPDACGPGSRRTNLRALLARPGCFEHHLLVVARVGQAQLEIPCGSEPLAFAHANVSDEYVVMLPTGEPLLDSIPFRVFVSDPHTGQDLLRIQHRVGELVLHPHGYLHWPGRLRPPHAPPAMPPDARRCVLSLVFCASRPTPPDPARDVWITEGLEARAKHYTAQRVPVLLADLACEHERRLARLGEAEWWLKVAPARIDAPRGGYLVVLDAAPRSGHHACDLVYLAPGASLDARGIRRGLWLASADVDAAPPPASWDAVPAPPFAPFEAGARLPLPFARHGVRAEAVDHDRVRLVIDGSTAEVPRYWLARLLFRMALHGYRMGYVETYGGFFHEDGDGRHRVGVRGGGAVHLDRAALGDLVEGLYRAVAPEGYTEDPR